MARRRKGDPPVETDLPITPMLDLAFQVLLFFIMTYHPSQLEGQMDLVLPDAAQAQAAKLKDADPRQSAPGDLELPAEITVLVKTQETSRDGSISRISVQGTVSNKDVADPEELRKYLQSLRPGLANQNDIKVQADSALKYGAVMDIMDKCSRAGFRNVSLGPPADLGPGAP